FDSKKSMAEHPLGRFLLSVFEAEIDGGLPQTIQALTANRYFSDPVERAAADPKFLRVDGYRNYLRRYAWYRGGAKREIKEIEGLRVEDLKLWREKLLSYAVPRRADGKEYVDRIREILASCESGEVTKRLVEECKDPSFASYLKQGQEKVEKLLEEAETLLTGYYLDAREMREILRSGLAAAEVSLIPMKNDAVFVGGLAESKFLPVKVLFAAGLKDGVPKVQEDTALLADKDLEQIRSVKIRIEPTVAQSNQRVRESVLLNLCSFTERIYATLSIDGSEGRSEIFAYLTHLFTYTGASGLRFFREGDDSPLLPALADRCATKELALKEMLLQKNDYESGRRDTTQIGSLYRAVTQTQEEKLRADGLYVGREKKKFLLGGEKLYLSASVSPTMLEEYFDCPYRCFLEKGLRLTRESVGATQSTDSGNFVHTVLERLAREMKEKRVSSEEECALTAERIARELTDEAPYRFERDTASGRYRLNAIVKESVEVSVAMFRTVERSDFEVDQVECWISRPLGERMLSGKVDRVDRAGDALRVVDYKTGSIDTKPDSYYSGRKLQLELYLGALAAEGSSKKPSGAFYFSASREFRKEEKKNYFMTGFFNEETLSAQDRTAEAGNSELFDNSQGKRSGKVLTDELFASFIDYAMLVSEKGVEEMAQGFIGACPYGGCPDWCTHKGVCGAEEGAGREKYSLTCTDIAEIARQEKEKREEQS
ncbi:MAG: PD-(D/E)XK nuclease family protein, partial [Christensenellaceae bacterium]